MNTLEKKEEQNQVVNIDQELEQMKDIEVQKPDLDIEELQKQNEYYRKKLSKTGQEAKKYREYMQANKEAEIEAAASAGEYKKLAEMYKEENESFKGSLAEYETNLTSLQEKANLYDKYIEVQHASIAKKSEALNDDQRRILDSISDISAKNEFLNMIVAKTAPAHDLGVPVGNNESSIEDLISGNNQNSNSNNPILNAIRGITGTKKPMF